MKTHTFEAYNGNRLNISKVTGWPEVALWTGENGEGTMHVKPEMALEMARVLKKAARRALQQQRLREEE